MLSLVSGIVWFSLLNQNQTGLDRVGIDTPVTSKEETIVKYGLPTRLEIPSIKVDAAIDYLGLTYTGDLDTPDGPDNVGWYKQGPRPGEVGNAVIDGHFGWLDGKPAVFDNLHKLSTGDKIHSKDEAGVTTSFVVTGTKTFSPEDDAAEVFRSDDGKAHLNLITCQGEWNAGQESYDTRLVVFADKE